MCMCEIYRRVANFMAFGRVLLSERKNYLFVVCCKFNGTAFNCEQVFPANNKTKLRVSSYQSIDLGKCHSPIAIFLISCGKYSQSDIFSGENRLLLLGPYLRMKYPVMNQKTHTPQKTLTNKSWKKTTNAQLFISPIFPDLMNYL